VDLGNLRHLVSKKGNSLGQQCWERIISKTNKKKKNKSWGGGYHGLKMAMVTPLPMPIIEKCMDPIII
jgi:hypothetical protein